MWGDGHNPVWKGENHMEKMNQIDRLAADIEREYTDQKFDQLVNLCEQNGIEWGYALEDVDGSGYPEQIGFTVGGYIYLTDFDDKTKHYSKELLNFVFTLGFGMEQRPIALEEAQADIDAWLTDDGLEDIPSDLTAEAYVDIWNNLVCD